MSVQQPLTNVVQFPIPITSLTRDNNQPTATATATTKWAHGMSVAQTRAISGATQSEYNSAGLTVTPINATQFTYGVPCTLWATTASGTASLTPITWNLGLATVQSGPTGSETQFTARYSGNQSTNGEFIIGDLISVSGSFGGSSYTGTYTVTGVVFDSPNNATFVSFTVASYTGPASNSSSITPTYQRNWPVVASVTSPSTTPTTTVTMTFSGIYAIPPSLSPSVTVSGLSPSQYNTTFTATAGASGTAIHYTITCPGDVPATPATGTIKVT